MTLKVSLLTHRLEAVQQTHRSEAVQQTTKADRHLLLSIRNKILVYTAY